jgi:hypothetical protein
VARQKGAHGVRVGVGLGTDEGGKHAFETAAKAPGFA